MTAREVLCRDVYGVPHRVEIVDRGPCPAPPGRPARRLVSGPHDLPYVRKSVPKADGGRDPRLYDLLENEVRILSHLNRVYAGRNPVELPTLAGYNLDADEPFALLRAYAGPPAAEAARSLDQTQRRQFQVSLLQALHLSAAAGVVHGSVSLATVRWTGAHVQLVDFESAQRAGEPRPRDPGPGQPPERRQGTGPADVRDDLWPAGVVIRELVLGTTTDEFPVDLSGDPERLRALLDGVFQPVEHRPYPAILLGRMRVAAPPPVLADPDESLADGHRRFEEASRRKAVPATATPSPRSGRGRWRKMVPGR